MVENKDINEQYGVLCNNIRHYRRKMRFTQEQLAEKSDLSISYIKQIESTREYKNLSLNTIFKIAKALNVDMRELFKDRN